MNEEIEQMRGIRELLIKALMVATGAPEMNIREAPLTVAIRFRKTLSAQLAPSAVIEKCAKVLDGCAQDWYDIRDPGMANNAKAYARKIRALANDGDGK
jgi:hypothetical protein